MVKTALINRLKYYFGVRMTDGKCIITTSGTQLSAHLGVSRATIYRSLKDSEYAVTTKYIVGYTDHLARQHKGDRRQLRQNISMYSELKNKLSEYYKEQKQDG
jgi:DeoR/GlpR family transcriptional regulator of sugar metabolism